MSCDLRPRFAVALEKMGRNLKEEICARQEQRSPYSVLKIVKIAIGLLDALKHMEKQSVWHRDFKLENILINKDGVYKLSDLEVYRLHEQKDRYSFSV